MFSDLYGFFINSIFVYYSRYKTISVIKIKIVYFRLYYFTRYRIPQISLFFLSLSLYHGNNKSYNIDTN